MIIKKRRGLIKNSRNECEIVRNIRKISDLSEFLMRAHWGKRI